MQSPSTMALLIIERFRKQGYAQVPGYNRFGFVEDRGNLVVVSRQNGLDTKIYITQLDQALAAVRAEPAIYDNGPSSLRAHGFTHVTSPLWSLIHLLSKDEILS
jgi:hypothetical protein